MINKKLFDVNKKKKKLLENRSRKGKKKIKEMILIRLYYK